MAGAYDAPICEGPRLDGRRTGQRGWWRRLGKETTRENTRYGASLRHRRDAGKTESTYQRYDIVVDEDLKAATEKLEQYKRAQEQPKLERVK